MASIPGLMRAIEDQARTRSLIRKVMSESGLTCQLLYIFEVETSVNSFCHKARDKYFRATFIIFHP